MTRERTSRSSPSRSGASSARSRDGSGGRIAAQEHLANVSRLRTVHAVAAGLWFLTVGCDWSATTFVTHGSLGWFLFWRAVVFVGLASTVGRLSISPPPSPALLRAQEIAVHGTAAVSIAMMALHYKGIASPYAHAVSCVLVARSVALPDRWQPGLAWGAIPASLFGITLAVAALFSPEVAAQFRRPDMVSEFALGVALQFVTLLLMVTGSHATWALRRKVFETRMVGRYILTKKLGAGAMGEVWLGHHPALKRDVAVKLLKGEANDAAVQRFEREVRATADLVHPNTVRVFDFGTTEEGDWFYVMEHVVGETLAARVKRDGKMPAGRVARVGAQAARALAEAHARGIVHRDIKPENLMLTQVGAESDFVKVLDFGVAKVMSERDTLSPDESLTREGALLGTPRYMAPEQGSGDAVDARADLYALGCVMYFALCAEPPFDTGRPTTTVLMHMTQPPPSFAEKGTAVPEGLAAVVMRCLEKSPDARFPDADALAAALAPLAHTDA